MIENPILLPILRLLVGALIGKDNLKLFDTLDWQDNSNFKYPEYYRSQNFHGITGGYLNAIAPVTYDAVTRFAAPPNEIKQREKAIAAIKHQPQNILDLGCGTGSSTLMLKQAFPDAEVTGLDISPYMIKMAEHKGKQANLKISWQQGLAEATSLADESFDLISVAFLFHETPVEVSQAVLQECDRLLAPGGQIIILDGNQQRLRHTPWLIKLFREPYSQVYAAGWIDDWLESAGFIEIETQPVGWVSQLSTAFKAQ
ncbi:MAG: class I SAM-dependent methyltransferase [Cyanobacteria bacterium J06600_6]